MKKIGVIYGMENTFPGALVDRINSLRLEDVAAEHIHVGGIKMAEPCGSDASAATRDPRNSSNGR